MLLLLKFSKNREALVEKLWNNLMKNARDILDALLWVADVIVFINLVHFQTK